MLELIISIAVVGLIVWAITNFVPMDARFKQIIWIIAIVCVVFFVLRAFGIFGGGDIPVPQLR